MKIYYSYISDFSDNDFDAFFKCISVEKQEKLQKVRNEKAKKESILAWYMLNKALSEKGVENYKVSFNDKGKPYLDDMPIFFNLTHSDGFVCCAVSKMEVGLDAEKIKSVKDSLINKVLTGKEKETLKNKDSDFIRFWTLKESLLKYKGSGITEELYRLDFSPFVSSEQFYIEDMLFTVKQTDGYFVSVCSEEKEREFIRIKA